MPAWSAVCCLLQARASIADVYIHIKYTVCSQLGQPAQLAGLLTCQVHQWASQICHSAAPIVTGRHQAAYVKCMMLQMPLCLLHSNSAHFSMHTLLTVQHIYCYIRTSAATLLGCARSIISWCS